jgi:integrase
LLRGRYRDAQLRSATLNQGPRDPSAYQCAERLAARNVANVVKAAAAKLGLDPATFGGHSLRSGLVTTAVKRGVNLMKVCDQTGHRSLEMLRVYTRDAELSAGNAAAGLL